MKGASGHAASQDTGSKILEILRERREVVSGEELSRLLGISRTAVWKHVGALRKLGYRFEAGPSRGYLLTSVPDILHPSGITAGLNTRRIGRSVVCLAETPSTNTYAFRLAEEGEPEGTVIAAESQSAGKGRMGRLWSSPSGVNLYCSIILRPRIAPVNASQITFLSAVAAARAIRLVTPLQPAIKWPNDILINGKKVAGLLNELSAETDGVNFLVLGIGINVNMRSEQFPSDLRHPATSLFIEGGVEVDRTLVLRTLLAELDRLYGLYLDEGYEPVRREWLELCNVMQRRVRVSDNDAGFTGVAVGIDEYGALFVRRDDGREERVLSGDVTLEQE